MSKHLFSFELNYAGFFFNDVQFEYAERSINERLTIETEGGCLHRKNYAFFFGRRADHAFLPDIVYMERWAC